MPRFYFHLRDQDHRLIRDEEGIDLPDQRAAVEEATASARELAAAAIREGRQMVQRIEVVGETGEEIFTFPVRAVVN